MGYYSQVGIGMFKEDFERLLKKTKFGRTDELKAAYKCLTEYCDSYVIDTYQETHYDADKKKYIPEGPEHKIVLLNWDWIKRYGIGMEYIKHYLETEIKHAATLIYVGEESGDVGKEEYNWDVDSIPWYEYIEPISYIHMERLETTEETGNFAEFINKLERRN